MATVAAVGGLSLIADGWMMSAFSLEKAPAEKGKGKKKYNRNQTHKNVGEANDAGNFLYHPQTHRQREKSI